MKKIMILIFLIFFAGFTEEKKTPIEVVIFVSSSCSSCKKASVMFYEMSNSVYKGKMNLTVKPLYKQLGDIALVAAENQDKLWDLISVYSHTNSRIEASNIKDLFVEAGIDLDKINKDIRDSTQIFSILDNNYAEAKKAGMNFTPHILINGEVFDGEVSPQRVMEYLDKLLKK